MAMYDATIATWESKYHYRRPRPSRDGPPTADRRCRPRQSVLSVGTRRGRAGRCDCPRLLPAGWKRRTFRRWRSRPAGHGCSRACSIPSDYQAGLELGRRVAEQVIAKAQSDGSDAVLDRHCADRALQLGRREPRQRRRRNWHPLLLSSPSQFRPPPPPACMSARGSGQRLPRVPRRSRARSSPTTRRSTGRAPRG